MEEFLKSINDYIKDERFNQGFNCKSFLVEHKTVESHHTFKAMKEYTVTIYIVKQNKKPVILFSHSTVFNGSKKSHEDVYKELSHGIMLSFFSIINTNEWEDILKGIYKSDIIE